MYNSIQSVLCNNVDIGKTRSLHREFLIVYDIT